MVGPPFITHLRDSTGTYRYGFLTLAFCLTCGASLIVLEHFLALFLNRRKNTKAVKDHEVGNHEMTLLETASSLPNSVTTTPIRPVVPGAGSAPHGMIAHIDEFDPLTPRPVSKPVFKPKTRKRKNIV